MTTSTDIKSVLEAMFSGIEKENMASGNKIADVPGVIEAVEHLRKHDINRFYFALIYPLENALDGLIAKEFSSREARFLLTHVTYVEENFKKLIVKYEGSGCSADKSRVILRALLNFFATGKEIVFNRDQPYTYHLPKYVFTTHAEIVEFFQGLHNLYYGSTEKFMQATINVHKTGQRALQSRMEEIAPDEAPTTPEGEEGKDSK